ncbi:MAG: YesL family protein [Lachnospiraceae bacterium]
MKFFSVDGPMYRFLSRFWDILRLNFYWLLFSLPIVTMGAATTAAFSLTMRMADETEGYLFRPFVKAFKENLKQGSVLGLLNLVLAYAVYLDFQLFDAVEGNPMYFLIFGIVGCFLCVGSFLYAYALTAKYENTLLNTLKNSMNISIRYFARTLAVVLVIAVEVLVFMFNQTTVFLGLLIGPACVFYTISGTANYIFRDIEKKNREEG